MYLKYFFILLVKSWLQESNADVCPNFSGCTEFFYKARRPIGFQYTKANIKEICQNPGIGFPNYYYATLYDTRTRIPNFSAYVLSRDGEAGAAKAWKLEHGLTANQQASNDEYDNSLWDRGHMNPNFYQSGEGRDATYVLTNAVPQSPGLNMVHWHELEIDAKNYMKTHCYDHHADNRAFFVTGAIPDVGRFLKRNNRVKIPKATYTAACCQNDDGQDFSFAYITTNSPLPEITILNVNKLAERILELWPDGGNNFSRPGNDLRFFYGSCGAGNEAGKRWMEEQLEARQHYRYEQI